MSSEPTSSATRSDDRRSTRPRNTKSAQQKHSGTTPIGPSAEEEDIPEQEQCLICAHRMEFVAVGACNHLTCHKCTLRQRSLYGKQACLVCRSENPVIVLSVDFDKAFESFSALDFASTDEKLGINFTQKYIHDATTQLMGNKCEICGAFFKTFKELSEHTKAQHGKVFCNLCQQHKRAFVSELSLYTGKQLQTHQSTGDTHGFTGHPECKYCRGKRFYSEDELNVHIRDRHERCWICDQYNPSAASYYRDYNSLYEHYRKSHYVCSQPICVERRFVVFRNDLDLTAHMLKEHGGIAGSNNRIVIGADTRHYQSQLSTFSNANRSINNGGDVPDSTDTKRKRLEERAKHYLNYDATKQEKFASINKNFKAMKISAQDLLKQYELLFEKQTPQELYLLVHEFNELLPENSELYQKLKPIVHELTMQNDHTQFPVLGKSASSSESSSSWVRGSKNGSLRIELFPALSRHTPRGSASSKPALTSAKPILKYSKAPKMAITAVRSSSPKLGHSSSTKSALSLSSNLYSLNPPSRNSSATSLPSLYAPRSASSDNVPDSKFPALQLKSTKKVIPRVNPVTVTDPKTWGKTSGQASVERETEQILADRRAAKARKKQDRILFSTSK